MVFHEIRPNDTFLTTELIIKTGIENLSIIDKNNESKDPREDLMVGRDEPVLFDGKQMYRKTKGKREMWRMVDAGGNFFKADSARPPEIISAVWEQFKKVEK